MAESVNMDTALRLMKSRLNRLPGDTSLDEYLRARLGAAEADLKKEGIKYVFYQDIFRTADRKLVVKAVVETVFLVNGRLTDYKDFEQYTVS